MLFTSATRRLIIGPEACVGSISICQKYVLSDFNLDVSTLLKLKVYSVLQTLRLYSCNESVEPVAFRVYGIRRVQKVFVQIPRSSEF